MTTGPLSELRHSCAHLLAAAVLELYPATLLTIGPAIEDGFYYDFDFGDQTISEHDFPKIEGKMRDLVKSWTEFSHETVPQDVAQKRLADNPYKLELLREIAEKGEEVTFYTAGTFTDLCRGGHSNQPSKELKHFKLLSIAGAYWRGSEKNKMLTRIYGTCFATKDELDAHLLQLEEAKKRDHRRLGRDLDLFTFSDYVGPGLPLYTQKGATIRRLLQQYVERIQLEEDYMQVWTPQIAKASLYKKSGHYDKYHEDMFQVVSHYTDEEMYLKPMNCPQHTQIYNAKPHSYRDLPIRMTDFAMLYRDERPGELNGLARVRSFSQDDCHVFCREDQVDAEIDRMLSMTKRIMADFNFSYRYRLSTRDPEHPEKYLGKPELWDKVEKWAVEIMKRNEIEYYDGPGEAAFYAPKMDLMATDALGREWQLSTIQIDYVMPERFELEYVGEDGEKKRPVMIHRAILGSLERFMMVLLEHYAGAFPTWLAPVQVKVLPVSEKHNERASAIVAQLKAQGVRAQLDDDNKTLGAKIRGATLQKIPFMGIIGDKECESDELILSIRSREGQDYGQQSVDTFLKNTFHTPISL